MDAKVVGAEALVNKLDEMIKSIDDLERRLPDEVLAWQSEDMHREFPFVKTRPRTHSVSVSTKIHPRSVKSMKSRAARRAQRRAILRAAHRRRGGPQRLFRTHPILRPQLLEALRVRIAELVKRVITWA
jgi:hypothetical protein